MPTYITLANYTQQGIENVEESPNRLDDVKSLIDSLGGELREFYLTMGEYDIVTVAEFPDDDAAAKALLAIGRAGAVSTKTLKAFEEDEFREIIADLP